MQLRSITLKHYRLLAFLLTIPPPWDSHLSPSAEQKESNKNRKCAKRKHAKQVSDKEIPRDSSIVRTSRVIFPDSNAPKSG
jgi:hypothetical protein